MKSTATQPTPRAPLTQRELEEHYFEMFQKSYSLPSGSITHDDKPDFILSGTRHIGIEMTNFYVTHGALDASEQAQQRPRQFAVSKGQQFYQNQGGKNIELILGFDRRHPIQSITNVAKRLANLARRVERDENGVINRATYKDIPELYYAYLYSRVLQYDDQPDPQFRGGQQDPEKNISAWTEYRNRREARALQRGIYKPLETPARWRLAQSHSFGRMSTQRLMEIIKEKEAKAAEYAKCEAYWLLIVVDFRDAAQEQEIRIDDFTTTSPVFEKIIVYKPYFEHILDVTAQTASAR